MKINGLIMIIMILCQSLVGQANDEKLSPRVKRLANRIGQFNVVMIGGYAMYLDERYQISNIGGDFGSAHGQGNTANTNNPGSRRTQQSLLTPVTPPVRTMGDSRHYNVSFRRYRAISSEREQQVKRFRDLTNLANVNELLLLLKDEKAAVRCYAFWALAEQHYPKLYDVLLEHYIDTQEVECFDDLDVQNKTVFEFMMLIMTPDKLDPFVLKMTPEQKEDFDHKILHDNNNQTETKIDLLMDLPQSEENYKLIRKFATRNNNQKAVVKISEYQKEADLNLISNLFEDEDPYYALKSCRYYPNQSFFEFLQSVHNEQINKKNNIVELDLLVLYQALVLQEDKENEIIEMLNQSLNVRKKSLRRIHERYIWLALHKYPKDQFDSIYNKIRIDNEDRRKVLRYVDF